MVSTINQALVIFKKNYTLNIRSYDYLKDLIPPLISAVFNIVAKSAPSLSFAAALYLPLSLSGFLRSFVYNFINEKAEKYKETQKIMGVKNLSYNLGWFLFNYAKAFFVGAVYLLPCLIAGVFSTSNLSTGEIILAYVMFIFAALNQCYMYTTFFSTPKLPSDLITLVHLIASALQYVAAVSSVQDNLSILNLLSLFPQTCIIFIFIQAGWNSQNSFDYDKMQSTYSFGNGITMLIFDAVLYFILYLYFDQVIQNEYGTQKDKLFFINWIWKKKSKKQISSNEDKNEIRQNLSINNNDDLEMNSSIADGDYSSAKYKEQFQNVNNLPVTVKVRNLVKKFGDFTAVDHLSVTLYEQQIFCLLGHNGAGKTTTISLLTGLLAKDEGKVTMNGLDLDDNIDTIRQNIGLCLQKDVLYDHLTVEEHLRFIGQIKGRSSQEIEEEISYLIQKCQLANEVGKTSKILSGGNKRKLSLAMALIGGSKIVFLDEPSSGLDFNARKEIKEILMQLKSEKRTVILTTHHLEEAEECADRIAIMAKGQLLTLGTNDFIKRNFGVGYHLAITKKQHNLMNSSRRFSSGRSQTVDQQQQQDIYKLSSQKCNQVREIVHQIIPEAKYNPQSSDGTAQFTLPFSTKDKFAHLFSTLESDSELTLDLEMNTLEDAFINIGMDEEKYLNPGDHTGQEKFTDFSNISVPDCLRNPPVFDFFNQTLACFQRKVFITIRSMSVLISFFLPMVLQLTGVFIARYAITSVDNTSDNPSEQISLQMLQIIIFGIFGMIAYVFVTTNFCGVPVMERELKLRYSLNVMGCRSLPYWLGTFIFDFLFISLNLYIFFIICFCIQFTAITDNFGSFFGLTQSFIFAVITHSYLISFLFQKAATAQKLVFFVNYIFFYTVPAIIYSKSDALQPIMTLISPFFCYNQGTQIIAGYTLPFPEEYISANYPSWQSKTYQYVLILLGQGVFFMLLALRVEKRVEKFKSEPVVDYQQFESQPSAPEVIAEDARVSNPNCQDKVKVSHLYKTYKINKKTPPYTAIKNNSFGVQNGEILGLLGPNGAGKSTTFNILTALIPKSQGSVNLKNIEVESGLMEIYQDVGICPQFDNIYESLSVIEHLRMFGRMKGLKGKDLEDSIQYFLKVMQLEDYVLRRAGRLSGGNKRKLCVTMALIGGPDMQFFDEPSSGVDPIARRFLWNTLSQSLKLRNGAIVLTTHSMDEAESLCSKIGILINGKFMCYGTPQFLKEKYGEGYKVSFKSDSRDIAIKEVQGTFQNAKLLSDSKEGETIAFIIPYQNFSLSKTFNFFENTLGSTRGLIHDFQIAQSSLASIFVYFSQFQEKREV